MTNAEIRMTNQIRSQERPEVSAAPRLRVRSSSPNVWPNSLRPPVPPAQRGATGRNLFIFFDTAALHPSRRSCNALRQPAPPRNVAQPGATYFGRRAAICSHLQHLETALPVRPSPDPCVRVSLSPVLRQRRALRSKFPPRNVAQPGATFFRFQGPPLHPSRTSSRTCANQPPARRCATLRDQGYASTTHFIRNVEESP
jgi:hypothetical protein